MQYDVVVSIITNDSEDIITDCLKSVQNAIHKYVYHVCVLDNLSHDATTDIVQIHFPQVDLIRQNCKRGFGANQNTILRRYQSQARYFLILNDDVVIPPHTIDHLIDYLDTHPEVGAVCPQLFYPDGTPQVSGTVLFGIEREILRRFGLSGLVPKSLKSFVAQAPAWMTCWLGHSIQGYLQNFESSHEPRPAGYLSAACMLVRGTILDEVGLFDEQINMYFEDTDWGRRANAAGWKLMVIPSERAVHYTGQSMGAFSMIERERSMLYYYTKYSYPAWSIALLARLTILCSFILFIIKAVQSILQPNATTSYREQMRIQQYIIFLMRRWLSAHGLSGTR